MKFTEKEYNEIFKIIYGKPRFYLMSFIGFIFLGFIFSRPKIRFK